MTCAAMRDWHERRTAQVRRVYLAPGVEMVFRGPISQARQALLEAAGRELAKAVLDSDLAGPCEAYSDCGCASATPDLADVDGGRRGD